MQRGRRRLMVSHRLWEAPDIPNSDARTLTTRHTNMVSECWSCITKILCTPDFLIRYEETQPGQMYREDGNAPCHQATENSFLNV